MKIRIELTQVDIKRAISEYVRKKEGLLAEINDVSLQYSPGDRPMDVPYYSASVRCKKYRPADDGIYQPSDI